ncbi:MAG TPA: hypothetical protein VGG46_00755 [Terriglobales bacterium]
MTPMVFWLLIVWGATTALLIALLIYRSTLTMHEDSQLCLSESDAHMQQEQMSIMRRMDRINPLLWGVGSLSGLLILVIAGLALYQQMTLVQ